MTGSILLIDDELDFLYSTKTLLADKFQIYEASDLKIARQILAENHIELVLLDITMPEGNGIDFLKEVKDSYPEIQIIMITAITDTKVAIEAIKNGAYDYLVKPYDPDYLPILCNKALEFGCLKRQHEGLLVQQGTEQSFKIIGSGNSMKKVFQIIEKVKDKPVTVLVSGETGTGKELIAKAIHFKGNRKSSPFIAVNCSAIPADIAEAELFGYEKGAFTSADQPNAGKFELANGGTIFLDEINSLDLALQAKILRVIQEKTVTRLGGSREIGVDIRIIAATNQNLATLVASGKFREDLYHRLNVIEIAVPPLRERSKKDLIGLINFFISKYSLEYHSPIKDISKEALAVFQEYNWPGNIRELQNIIERIIIMEDTKVIHRYQLPLSIRKDQADLSREFSKFETGTLKERLDNFERQQILAELNHNKLNVTLTAKKLGIHRTTLNSKFNLLNIDIEQLRK